MRTRYLRTAGGRRWGRKQAASYPERAQRRRFLERSALPRTAAPLLRLAPRPFRRTWLEA